MSEIFFLYRSTKTMIECKKDELMKEICQKFANKVAININDLYFLYNGNKINEDNTFAQQAISEDNTRNKMNIYVYECNDLKTKENKVKSNDIICPECGELSLLKISDYKINLSNCKNGHTKELFFNEYEDTQYINEEKIICEICKKVSKAETFNKKFYKCLSCNQNLCPLCYLEHNKNQNHFIVDYSQRNYICDKHNEKYDSYCNICKKNLCLICSSEHNIKHNNIYFKDIISQIDYNQFNILKTNIEIMKDEIDYLIEKLNKVKEGIDIYYNISNTFINNNNIKNRNYQSLINLKNISSATKDINMDIQNIIKENNENNKFKTIMEIYVKITRDPTNLNYKKDITNNIKGWGLLNNFAVYNGLKDNIEYIVYNNKNNYNLDIMRIYDKAIINSLKGHTTGTNVIRYYINNNREEYIISCDKKNLVIVWDIQNNYNKKYNIKVNDFGNIWDALLLFNIFKKNYILISSWNKDEFSKLHR